MGMPTTKHHTRLEQLRVAAAQERTTDRELQLAATRASTAAAEAREALIEAHASGSDIRRAEKANQQAQAAAEEAAIRAEAAALRVKRAEQEAQTYEAQHARDLIAELQPRATAAVEGLTESARALYAAHNEWHQISTEVVALLRHVPGALPANNVSSDHALASVARDLRNFIREDGEVVSPMPHWQGEAEQQAEERRRLKLRRDRGEVVERAA